MKAVPATRSAWRRAPCSRCSPAPTRSASATTSTRATWRASAPRSSPRCARAGSTRAGSQRQPRGSPRLTSRSRPRGERAVVRRARPGGGAARAPRLGHRRDARPLLLVDLEGTTSVAAGPPSHDLASILGELGGDVATIHIAEGQIDRRSQPFSEPRAPAGGRPPRRRPASVAARRCPAILAAADGVVVDVGYPAQSAAGTNGRITTFGSGRASLTAAAELLLGARDGYGAATRRRGPQPRRRRRGRTGRARPRAARSRSGGSPGDSTGSPSTQIAVTRERPAASGRSRASAASGASRPRAPRRRGAFDAELLDRADPRPELREPSPPGKRARERDVRDGDAVEQLRERA